MDRKIGKGTLSANSVIVYSSIFSRLLGLSRYRLSFSDPDAYPFGAFFVVENNMNVEHLFVVGKQGTTHRSLFQIVNSKNQRYLGENWWQDRRYLSLARMFSSGRIWTKKKIIVMRDNRFEPKDILYVVSQLTNRGIPDIYSYVLLYEDDYSCIHECEIIDYINGCADKYVYTYR